MRSIVSRVRRLEDMKQVRQDAQEYTVVSPCGRVTATVSRGRRGVVMAKIGFPYPDLNAPLALDLIRDRLPVRCVFFAQPSTAFTIEEYQDWTDCGGPYEDGSPVLFGRLEQPVH